MIAEDGQDKIKIIATLGLIDPHLAAVGFHHVADKIEPPPGADLAFDIAAAIPFLEDEVFVSGGNMRTGGKNVKPDAILAGPEKIA